MEADRPTVFDLSPAEKLQLVQDLWDDLAADPAAIPVEEWQQQELDRRKENLRQHQGSGLTWEAVKRRILRERLDKN